MLCYAMKARAEAWHLRETGLAVTFSVCLLNRYEGGDESLGWHADREEMEPALGAPRSSPIASISLGAVRRFGMRLKSAPQQPLPPLPLGHGSLCVMENAFQMLYHHSLLPEPAGHEGVRVNLTFRSKSTTRPHVAPTPPAPAPPSPYGAGGAPVFVGLASGVHHTPLAPGSRAGFKQRMHHAFESPFASDTAATAALRYRTWLLAQPLFHAFVCSELRGRALDGGAEKKKRAFGRAHVAVLSAIVAEHGALEASRPARTVSQ